MNTAQHSFRRSERLAVVIPARCRSRSGFIDRVVIADISREGCRIESMGLTVHAGDIVIITPNTLEGQPGKVRWVSGHSAGIEFDTPLYGPVVEHLYRKFRSFLASPEDAAWPVLRLAA